MKKALIIVLVCFSLTAIFVFGSYAFLAYSVKAMHKKQTIAEDAQITSDWQEITPEQPLKSTKQVQKIMLSIEGFENDLEKPDFENIKLADGTTISPEIQIVDENGKVYQLKHSAKLGNDVGFSPIEKVDGNHQFPKNVSFKTVKIRSDKPFRCEKIYWYDYDLK